jgi:tetratricopeptide (TPR) repeat protein
LNQGYGHTSEILCRLIGIANTDGAGSAFLGRSPTDTWPSSSVAVDPVAQLVLSESGVARGPFSAEDFPATAILAIAVEVLAGHVAGAAGDHGTAAAHLRTAVELEDDLLYGEPPEWSIPVRQELGAMLLAAGRAEEAETAYREDLERFPENAWSLEGLSRSLAAQGRAEEAAEAGRRFEAVRSPADAPPPLTAVRLPATWRPLIIVRRAVVIYSWPGDTLRFTFNRESASFTGMVVGRGLLRFRAIGVGGRP